MPIRDSRAIFRCALAGFSLAIINLLTGVANATQVYSTGQITYFRSTDSSTGADKDYFALDGVSSLGTCGVYQGQVLFILKDDGKGNRQYAFVLSALRAGVSLTVYVDDQYKTPDGYCYVRTVE